MSTRCVTIPLQSPDDPYQKEVCASCIREQLQRRPGIQRVEVDSSGDDSTIELHFDPQLLSLAQVRRYVERAGGCISPDIAHVMFHVEGMASPRCEQSIEVMLGRLPGVAASASFASRSVRVEFDRRQCVLPEIVRRLDRLGFRVRMPADADDGEQSGQSSPLLPDWLRGEQAMLWVTLAGGLLLLGAWLTHGLGGPSSLRYGLLVASYLCGTWFTGRAAWQTLRQGRLDIDLLMFAAAFGAAALQHYEEGALLLFLFGLGQSGEDMAMDRARRAISALAELAPRTAVRRLPDGTQREVSIESLAVDDEVMVRPADRIPVDGEVIEGDSPVDQSPITGESVPVDKSMGDEVFAGTINGDGLLVVRVARSADQSTLARVIALVAEAQTTKSPTQLFTDRFTRWYVPAVLLGTLSLILVPPLMGWEPLRTHDSHWAGWFYQAMAFLTAASPCALAIGTPAAVLCGIARAARIGVLIKGGVHLENLGRVDTIAFDKTGTLTRGRAQVSDLLLLAGHDERTVLTLAASLEQNSQHPLAQAIVSEAQARECALLAADDVEQIAGKGVRGQVDGRQVAVGRPSLVEHDGPTLQRIEEAAAAMREQGKAVIVVTIDREAAGLIALADQPRENAAEALAAMKSWGVRRTIMLTGDHQAAAAAIARRVGVDEYRADLLPEQKVDVVRQIERDGAQLAMVGDGVNDAPALAGATVGIAMGGAGTDVALEAADVALMGDDLAKLPDAIGLSRRSRHIIAQNLVIALGVIAILAPAAALGFASLGWAVLLHEGSTVVVVLNALRLLRYGGPGPVEVGNTTQRSYA
jgi:Cd2+/Zn2+-exporting ATPase